MRSLSLSVRAWVRHLALTCPLVFSGCMAVETVQGESTVYSQSPLVTLVIGLGGLAFAVIGIGALVEALPYALQTSAAKRRGRKGGPKRKNGIAQIMVGGLMAAIGLVLVTYGVPSTLLSSVTVGPDAVTLKHGSFLFMSSTKAIPYDSITGFNVEEFDTRGFKGRKQVKRILHLSHSGGHERIEMNSMHVAAMPKLEEAYAAYRNRLSETPQVAAASVPEIPSHHPTSVEVQGGGPLGSTMQRLNAGVPTATVPQIVASNPAEDVVEPAAAPDREPAQSPATAGMTPVSNLGRLQPERFINVRRESGLLYAEILEVFAERKLRVRYPREPALGEEVINLQQVASVHAEILDSQSTPPGTRIASVSDVVPGDILLDQHGSDWYPVEVLAIQPPDRVRVTWVDEPRGNHSIPLAWCCRIPDAGAPSPAIANTTASANNPASPPGTASSTGQGIATGQKMEAFWGNKWYPVEVLSVGKDGKIRIHYIGYADSWDTDVEPDKLRPMTSAKAGKK